MAKHQVLAMFSDFDHAIEWRLFTASQRLADQRQLLRIARVWTKRCKLDERNVGLCC